MESIKRDVYLKRLKDREQNGLVKIITGIRRCGNLYLLNTLFFNYLKEKRIKDNHIIKISLDDDENSNLLLSKALSRYIKNLIANDGLYYILLDEIQLADNFERLLYLRCIATCLFATKRRSKNELSERTTQKRISQ